MSTLSVMRLSDRRESHTKHQKSATEMKFKAKFTTEKFSSLRVLIRFIQYLCFLDTKSRREN